MDDCPEYAKKLELYFNSHTEFGYHAVFLSAPEMAQEYVQSGAVALILAAETLEKEVLLLAGNPDVPVFWLCEEKKKVRENAIFRYQPARLILEQLGKREEKRDSLPVFSVFSPSGGVWQEEFFCRIANGFSERHRVLCFSLLPFASECRTEENGMSELLFYVKQGQEAFLNFLRRQEAYGRNPATFGSLRWSTDLQNITPSDVEEMIRGGVAAGGYDLILFAVGYYDAAGRSILASSDKLKENNEMFQIPSDSKYAGHFSKDDLKNMREPDYIRKYVRYYKLDSFGSVTVAYKEAEKEMQVYQSTRLTNKQKADQLKDYAETYQMIQKVKAVYEESRKKSPVGRIVFDNLHKEELAEYHRLVEKLNGMLDGAKATPKKWDKEIKELQAEIAALDIKIEAKYTELICEEAIEHTVKHGGKVKSLKHKLDGKKEDVKQKDRDDNPPENSDPSHSGINDSGSQEPEERKKNKPSWDAL